MKSKIKQFFYRRKILKKSFFENVNCNKPVRICVANWLTNLYAYKGITVNSFSELFHQYDSISFPINIILRSKSKESLIIMDVTGNNFCFYFSLDKFDGIDCYSITNEKDFYSQMHTFQFTNYNDTILSEFEMSQLDENRNRYAIFTINYNYSQNRTVVSYDIRDFRIEIVYSLQNSEFDNKVLTYLTEISYKYHNDTKFMNILSILIALKNNIGTVDFFSIKSSFDSDILSEIVVIKGFVTKYSFTEKISNSEICLHILSTSQDINEFIYMMNNYTK